MKNYCMPLLLIATSVCLCSKINAQSNEKDKENENPLHHRVSVVFSQSHIPAANETNVKKQIFIAPVLGVNYELWFNRKWAVGLHNDFTMETFNVKKSSGSEIIERDYPVLITLVALYKPVKHWSFFAGPGKEFEKNESFHVIKTGIEYGITILKTWEIGFGFEYDIKLKGYSTWQAGIGFSKNFY
ncbi:MAG: hypothetical protein SFU87_08740 [Chitinophagaceae bacterium]|nr:hypothetical protein [Chitinophagaceae bacterium]